ncbi:uncharacterized protein LOC108678721 [Hyalella azteca]|uniref:Uncharacterized protein LOC108678721 n=1 Tax=Hyalella azteca TaxID=294128 RepID=A0A979FY04_HYAAZ|nr:uncharacterized protein LOC108678721 [Hyalella azteca]
MQGWVPELHLSLVEPSSHHLLKYLNHRNHTLDITVQHESAKQFTKPQGGGPSQPRPLPTSTLHPPTLTVCLSPEGGSDDVIALVEGLAPENKRFSSLRLSGCHLGDDEVVSVVWGLQQRGVRTTGGTTGYTCARFDDGRCAVCGEKGHDPHQRCLTLTLSPIKSEPISSLLQSLRIN